MTANFDLRAVATPNGVAPEPTSRPRPRGWWLPIGLVAGAVTVIGGVAVVRNVTSTEHVPSTPAGAVVVHPHGESSIIRAERAWAGEEFELAPVDHATPSRAAESSIIRAERAWAGDEFDTVPTADVCLMHSPC